MRPKELAVSFIGFWPNFDKRDNIFVHALKERYIVTEGEDADIAFYSVFGEDAKTCGRTSVFYTGEPLPPRLDIFDWAFSFDYDETLESDRHLRLPLYVLSANIRQFHEDWGTSLVKSADPSRYTEIKNRKNFCAYISYHDGFVRCLLFDKLNRFKKVSAPGRSRNNTSPISGNSTKESRINHKWQEEKRRYLLDFRFAIVCENVSYSGYTSEKLLDAMMAGCIPIYWGNPEVSREFNARSFINLNEYEEAEARRLPAWIRKRPELYKRAWRHWVMPRAVDKAVRRIQEIENNEDLFRQITAEPWFEYNRPNIYFEYQRFRERMIQIAEFAITRRVPIAGD